MDDCGWMDYDICGCILDGWMDDDVDGWMGNVKLMDVRWMDYVSKCKIDGWKCPRLSPAQYNLTSGESCPKTPFIHSLAGSVE